MILGLTRSYLLLDPDTGLLPGEGGAPETRSNTTINTPETAQTVVTTVARMEQMTRRVGDLGNRQGCGKDEGNVDVHKEEVERRKGGEKGPTERECRQRTRPNYEHNNQLWFTARFGVNRTARVAARRAFESRLDLNFEI